MEFTAGEAWSRILEAARARLPAQSFSTWLEPTSALGLTEDTLVIGAPSAFAVEWIEDKYGHLLTAAAAGVLGRPIRLVFESRPSGSSFEAGDASSSLAELEVEDVAREQLAASCVIGTLNPRYTLSQFVIARNSQLAAAAAGAASEAPGRSYNPLFIHGGVGLGKTHLMQSIGHEVLRHDSAARVAYVPCEQFTNELIEAIQARRTREFHARYRRIDVLLVDDVHFLADKEATQEEFFHTFNALHDAQRQIVLTSDRPPSDIAKLQDRLVSRFEWGLVTDIQPPDFETRMAILRLKASRDELSIPDDVLAFIARHCPSSVRALEGALIKLLALSSLGRCDITIELAQNAISSSQAAGAHLTADQVARAAAREFGVTLTALRSRGRARDLVVARQVAMYLMRELLDLPLSRIGAELGGRDHSTVLHGLGRVQTVLSKEAEIASRIASLRDRLGGSA